MKVSSTLLTFGATAVAALSTLQLTWGETPSVSLQVGPADASARVASLAFRATGLAGGRDPIPAEKPAFSSEVPAVPAPGFYPADVSNPLHRPTVISAEHHPIYVNNPSTHWGNPGAFLTDLGKSQFIHLLDQYVGTSANNRYTLGTSFNAIFPIPANHTLQITDILALVHAGASVKGGGLGHIYHVFLPKGVDTCLPDAAGNPTICYSPDNPNTFAFCAYHSAVTFAGPVGHVVFTVEPFTDVPGCSVPPTGTANGQLIDSVDSVLSHEVFELISDPNLDAWFVQALTFAFGNEIGDLCTLAVQIGRNFYFGPATVNLNGHPYSVQAEYSNQVHGCAYKLVSDDE